MAPRGENRTKLIDAMKTLSLSKGYAATTVDEVCAEADVSKGSFYHHFETKEDIGFAALDSHFDQLVEALTVGTFNDQPDPVERLRSFIEHTRIVCAGPQMINGCLIGSYALDLAETLPSIQNRLAEQFNQLAHFVAKLISEASQTSGIHLPSKELSQQFLVVIEGSIVLAKAHADKTLLTSGIELFGHHLDLLLEQQTAPKE